MEQIRGSVSSSKEASTKKEMAAMNVVALETVRKESPPLSQLLKDHAELRGFYRYVHRYGLRAKALELLEKQLYLTN